MSGTRSPLWALVGLRPRSTFFFGSVGSQPLSWSSGMRYPRLFDRSRHYGNLEVSECDRDSVTNRGLISGVFVYVFSHSDFTSFIASLPITARLACIKDDKNVPLSLLSGAPVVLLCMNPLEMNLGSEIVFKSICGHSAVASNTVFPSLRSVIFQVARSSSNPSAIVLAIDVQ